MKDRQNAPRNPFARQLEELLLEAGIKNAAAADALSYDVSYISKWVTGKALPSRKNLEKVLETLGGLIAGQDDPVILQKLQTRFGGIECSALRSAVTAALRDAYYDATGEISESLYVNNAVLRVMPQGRASLLDAFTQALESGEELHVMVMADLFSLDHVFKLQLAGIEAQRFRMHRQRRQLHIDFIIDLQALDGSSVYDVILLIHLMTHYSLCSFRLFSSNWARDKLVVAVQGHSAGITVLTGDNQLLCTTTTREKNAVNEVCDSLSDLIDPDKRLFLTTSMDNMLSSHDYLHNLLSRNNRWLVGHVTEHFLPEDLFRRLSADIFGPAADTASEAERAYLLSANALRKNHTRLMLYHLAAVNFALSGELDFFNRKVLLPPEQRQEVLLHIRELVQNTSSDHIKLVKDGFSDDFKYITNPCLFLSDSASYLRLENTMYCDNLLLIQDDAIKRVFNTFFEKIWCDDQDAVIEDHVEILAKLDHLIEIVSMM